MSADQEIRRHAIPRPAHRAVGAKTIAAGKCCGQVGTSKGNLQTNHRPGRLLTIRERNADLGPDDLAGDQAALRQAGAKGLGRTPTVDPVAEEDVEKDVGVDGSDQD